MMPKKEGKTQQKNASGSNQSGQGYNEPVFPTKSPVKITVLSSEELAEHNIL